MPNMSLLELLFAVLLLCVLAATGGVAVLVWSLLRRAEGQAVAVAELRGRLETGGLTQESQAVEIREPVSQTQAVVERPGSAREHTLEEVLKHPPPEMLQRNVWVAGKVVELALQLPGGKLLPIDSKWVSSGALEQLAETDLDAPRRAQLTAQVEREVERRVREVSQYIDPAMTSPFAL